MLQIKEAYLNSVNLGGGLVHVISFAWIMPNDGVYRREETKYFATAVTTCFESHWPNSTVGSYQFIWSETKILNIGEDPKNSRTRLGNRKGLQVCCSKTAVSLILHSQVFLKLSAVSKAICERRWGVSCLADTNLKKNLQHKPFVPVWLCWYSNCNMYPSGLLLTC